MNNPMTTEERAGLLKEARENLVCPTCGKKLRRNYVAQSDLYACAGNCGCFEGEAWIDWTANGYQERCTSDDAGLVSDPALLAAAYNHHRCPNCGVSLFTEGDPNDPDLLALHVCTNGCGYFEDEHPLAFVYDD